MITEKATCNKVKKNLVYYNLWSNVTSVDFYDETLGEQFMLLKGKNPKSGNDSACINGYDYVLPVLKQKKLTMQALDLIFKHVSEIEHTKVQKLVIGITDFDRTIVYYNIHSGVQKPKNA